MTLAEGEGKKAVKSQLPAGMLALHNGLGLSLESYGDFIRVVSEDPCVRQTRRFRWLSSKPAKQSASPSRLIEQVRRYCQVEADGRF